MANSNRMTASSTNRYTPAPTAPKLEFPTIEICDAALASRSSLIRKPPPYTPPSPPSVYAETILTPNRMDKRFKARISSSAMFKVALFEGITAACMLGGGTWCLCGMPDYCPYHSALWSSAVFLLNAFLGLVTARRATVNMFVGHLVLSLVSLMLCAVSAAISARNWFLVGTYQHPKIGRNEAFCLIGEHDASRLQYIFSQLNRYDFKHCIYQLKEIFEQCQTELLTPNKDAIF